MLVLLRLWFFLRKTTLTSPELRYNRLCYGRLDYFQVYSLLYLIFPEGQKIALKYDLMRTNKKKYYKIIRKIS